MTDLKFYESKDGPAGDALDLKAKILSADMKITYAEALALALQMDPAGARQYIEKPNETRVYSEAPTEAKGAELDSKAKQYASEHGVSYSEAVTIILKNEPDLYEV